MSTIKKALHYSLHAALQPLVSDRLDRAIAVCRPDRVILQIVPEWKYEIAFTRPSSNVVSSNIRLGKSDLYQRTWRLGDPNLFLCLAEDAVVLVAHDRKQRKRLGDCVSNFDFRLKETGLMTECEETWRNTEHGKWWKVQVTIPGPPPYQDPLIYHCEFFSTTYPDDRLRVAVEVDTPGHYRDSTSICSTPNRLCDELALHVRNDELPFHFSEVREVDEYFTHCWRGDIQTMLAHQMPWESTVVPGQIKQGLLAAKPVLLAQDASETEGRWMEELAVYCLEQLAKEPPSDVTLIRQLFFALLVTELAGTMPHLQQTRSAYWQTLGRRLADRRRDDPSLPFNPLFPYRRLQAHRQDAAALIEACRLSDANCQWFLRDATLDDIVRHMGLV